MTKTRLALILGSGFSASAGYPNTNDLTETVLSIAGNNVQQVGSSTSSMPAMQVIRRALTGYYDQINFEIILHAIEVMQSVALAGAGYGVHDLYKPVMNAFMDTSPRWGKVIDSSLLSSLRHDITNQIFNCILNRVGGLHPDSFAQHRQFLGVLRDDFVVHCFTLNYDNLIERLGFEWFDSFTPTTVDGTHRFVVAEFLNEFRNRGILCHLHGSVHFGYEAQLFSSEIVKLDDPVKALTSHKTTVTSLRRPPKRGHSLL